MGTGARPPIHRTASAVLAAALALAAVFADTPARWLVATDPPQVAGRRRGPGRRPRLRADKDGRSAAGHGEVRVLIVTGGEPAPGDSAASLRDVAIRAGVPPERIRMEQVSHSTHGSMEAIRPILEQEGIRSLAVVTSPYHQRRAVWAARRTLKGIEIVSRPADPSGWQPAGWWKTRWNRRIVLGEYARLAYYVLRGWA